MARDRSWRRRAALVALVGCAAAGLTWTGLGAAGAVAGEPGTGGGGVTVDLRAGRVAGEDPAVRLLRPPQDSDRDGWHEALLAVDLMGCRGLELIADYDGPPDGFSLNVGDSSTNNGWAGDGATQSNDAEAEVCGDGLSVWGNDDLPADQRHLLDRRELIGVGTRLRLRVSDGELTWSATRDGQTVHGSCRSPHLFALDGQPDREGPVNYEVYVGLNRVVAGGRRGHGLGQLRLRVLR